MKKQSTSGSSLPSDLISDILLRLPAKSVGRFRCVSKLWLSLATDPCFIKSFEAIPRQPSLLLCSINGQNMFVSYSSSQPVIRRYPMKPLGEECYFSRMDSVHGLICIEDEKSRMPLIWNPTTGQLLSLSKPNMSSRYMNTLLGYDPVEGKHKLVCLPHKQACTVCRVFTFGSGQESWRDVRTNLEHMCGYASGRCINGVIYYLAKYCHWYHHTDLMSIDVKSEIFCVIELPSTNIHDDVLMTYEGRLDCIVAGGENGLWSLEDADEHEWSSQDFLKPLHKRPFELQGSTQAGRLHRRFDNRQYYLPYEDLGLTASPEPSYEDPRLTRITCTMLKIP